AIKLPDVSELLGKGKHKIEVKMTGGAQMPYSVGVTYNALKPDTSKECKVGLEVKLAKSIVAEGELLEANATVTNVTKELIPTAIAIVGLPGGLEPRHDQLKELVKKGTIDSYEVLGREVVLYWRGMTPGQRIEVPLSLLAAVPGSYTGPASRAYLYYTDEHKVWVDGLKVAVTPKG
ncbi:MAG: MG2 domain-containing protein, partial [Myxococcaceae bacterium]